MQTEEDFDVLVLGGGPAGAAAALFAARQGLRVAVLERQEAPPAATWLEWLHPRGREMLTRAGVASRDALLGTIDRVRFVDMAHGRIAPAPVDAKVEVVDTLRLTQSMLATARAAGARLMAGAQIISVDVREDTVTLHASTGRRVSGKILIFADGCDSLAVRSFGPDSTQTDVEPAACCQAVYVRASDAASTKVSDSVELEWILTGEDLESFGYLFTVGRFVAMGLVTPAAADGISGLFERALGNWHKAGILPEDLEFADVRTEVRAVPRGAALERDSHVAKRSLLVGDAGGYVAAASHEGLYPAIWSARLAVEVSAAALAAEHPQDVLAEFDARWRREMVAYLRLPNADLRFLLPLVFTNERMARKLAGALLGGENL